MFLSLTSRLAVRLYRANRGRRPATATRRSSFRPDLLALEDRAVPATWVVSKATDLGVHGELGYAVEHAQPGDRVKIAAGLKDTPIVLTRGLLAPADLTIEGLGHRPATIVGSFDNGDLSEIGHPVIEGSGGLTLSNLMITGFSSNYRAAVEGGALTLNHCVITGNTSTTYSGGIAGYGTVTLNDSTVSGNTGYYGGVISSGTLTLNNSIVSGNAGYYGGGLTAYSGTLTLNHSTVSGNTGYFGGGIWARGAAVALNDSTVSGNTATYGGGIYSGDYYARLATTTLTFSGSSSVTGNTASYGGGIANDAGSSMTVGAGRIAGNTASYGGGVYNAGGSMAVGGSQIVGNTATVAGGGLYNGVHHSFVYTGGDVVIDRLTFGQVNVTNSMVRENVAVAGGGIYNDAGTVAITDSLIASNTADSGGGVYNRLATFHYYTSYDFAPFPVTVLFEFDDQVRYVGTHDGQLTLTASTVTGNAAATAGGGVYNDGGTLAFDSWGSVFGNTAPLGANVYT